MEGTDGDTFTEPTTDMGDFKFVWKTQISICQESYLKSNDMEIQISRSARFQTADTESQKCKVRTRHTTRCIHRGGLCDARNFETCSAVVITS